VPLDGVLTRAPLGQWQSVKVRLACFRRDGETLAAVSVPASISTTGRLGLSISELRLAPNQNDGVCP
jgi:beta-glucosidase